MSRDDPVPNARNVLGGINRPLTLNTAPITRTGRRAAFLAIKITFIKPITSVNEVADLAKKVDANMHRLPAG